MRRAAPVRARPDSGARVVGRMDARTAEGTTNIVVALSRAVRHGAIWVRVRVPHATGWSRASTLGGYGVVDTRLIVDRRRLTATLLRAGRPVFRARVGIGRRGRADARRDVLRPRPADPLREPDLWPDRLRDERDARRR